MKSDKTAAPKKRWPLAQEQQKINQLNKKKRLLNFDRPAFLKERVGYAKRTFDFISPWISVGKDSKILEVGSGSHGISFFFPRGVRIALDPLAGFYSREFAFLQSGSGALVTEGRGEELPFPARIFDAVISDNVLDHTDDAQHVLEEIHRVLKDEGVFFLKINVHHWTYSLMSAVYKTLQRLHVHLNFPNFRAHTYFFTYHSLKRAVVSSGFQIVVDSHPEDLPTGRKFSFLGGKPFKNFSCAFVCRKQA